MPIDLEASPLKPLNALREDGESSPDFAEAAKASSVRRFFEGISFDASDKPDSMVNFCKNYIREHLVFFKQHTGLSKFIF